MKNEKELEIGGLSFGLTSGIITTLGLIVGINSATSSKLALIAAILTVAVADSFADALGMYLSEESRKDEANKPIWTISFFTFLGKLIFSMLFLIPVLYTNSASAVKTSIILGVFLITALAIYIAHRKHHPILREVFGHVSLAILVIIVSYFLGHLAEKIN